MIHFDRSVSNNISHRKDTMWWIILILMVVLVIALVIAYIAGATTMWYLIIIGAFVFMAIIIMAWSFTRTPSPPPTTQTVYHEVPTQDPTPATTHHTVTHTHMHHNVGQENIAVIPDVPSFAPAPAPTVTMQGQQVRTSTRPVSGAKLDPDPVSSQTVVGGQQRRVTVSGPQGVQGATFTEPSYVVNKVSDVPDSQVRYLRPGERPPQGAVLYQVLG